MHSCNQMVHSYFARYSRNRKISAKNARYLPFLSDICLYLPKSHNWGGITAHAEVLHNLFEWIPSFRFVSHFNSPSTKRYNYLLYYTIIPSICQSVMIVYRRFMTVYLTTEKAARFLPPPSAYSVSVSIAICIPSLKAYSKIAASAKLISETIELFLLPKSLAGQGFSAFSILGLVSLWSEGTYAM